MPPFIFTDSPIAKADTMLVVIPKGIPSLNVLFDILKKSLSLPEYFGENLDALSDCLTDLHWVDQRCVLMVHEGQTFYDERLFGTYLSVLGECVEDWQRDPEPRLYVAFPLNMSDKIRSLFPL